VVFKGNFHEGECGEYKGDNSIIMDTYGCLESQPLPGVPYLCWSTSMALGRGRSRHGDLGIVRMAQGRARSRQGYPQDREVEQLQARNDGRQATPGKCSLLDGKQRHHAWFPFISSAEAKLYQQSKVSYPHRSRRKHCQDAKPAFVCIDDISVQGYCVAIVRPSPSSRDQLHA
jgi:hypothetical protein